MRLCVVRVVLYSELSCFGPSISLREDGELDLMCELNFVGIYAIMWTLRNIIPYI